MARGARTITVKELRADAAVLESVVLQYRYATPEELAPHRPGGDENTDKGARGWLRWYVKLQRFHAQGERTARPQNTPAFAKTEAERLALLRGAPVPVELLARAAETGAPAYVHVHPKSLGALTDCHQRDLVLAWLAAQYRAFHDEASVKGLELRARLLDEMLYQQRVLAWIVCTPGPRLPFDESTVRPQPPEQFVAMDAVDIYRIIQAHQLVNSLRLQTLVDLYDTGPTPNAERPSWTVWAANVADALGIRSEVLINDWSLGEAVAQHALVVKAMRDAEAKAKAEAVA